MSVLTKRSAGVAQRTAALWRKGVRPDKGYHGHDEVEQQTFPKWFVPSIGEWYHVPKDEAVLRDRLCGVKLSPGQYTAGGEGKLLGWLLINRTGRAVVRNPYTNNLDTMGQLVSFEQCAADGWKRPTMFRVQAAQEDSRLPFTAYVTMQALMTWNWQDHWHPKLMRSTWDNNAIDVFNALQDICQENLSSYQRKSLDLSDLPIVRFQGGHPSPPRWKLPHYPHSRKPVDKVETGWDHSEWNWHPSPFGDHRANPAIYPELRGTAAENKLDQHLDSFGRHPHKQYGARGWNAGFGGSGPPSYQFRHQTQNPDSGRAIPDETARMYRNWAVYENKYSAALYNGCKETTIGPWPFAQPVRSRIGNPLTLP
eukprot:gene14998-22895_t